MGIQDHITDEIVDDTDEFLDLIVCTTAAITEYYCTFIHKIPCMTSYQTGHKWMQ